MVIWALLGLTRLVDRIGYNGGNMQNMHVPQKYYMRISFKLYNIFLNTHILYVHILIR